MNYQTKCIMEDINEGVIVLGEYNGFKKSDASPVPLDIKVLPRQACADGGAACGGPSCSIQFAACALQWS